MARKLRAVLPDLGLKGEKAVVTEVRYLVSIVGGCLRFLAMYGFCYCSVAREVEMLVVRGGVVCGGDGDLVAELGRLRLAIDGWHRFHMTFTLFLNLHFASLW